MSITKSLGGDRLGSGNKMDVQMHAYNRSTHDLGYVWRSTMSPGTLVPFMKELALPGDTFDINLDAFVNTHPTIGPLFGSFKLQLDVFECPIRLYQGQLHNNKLGIGLKMQNVKLPRISQVTTERPATNDERYKDIDNCQINPSCILSYLDIRGIGFHEPGEAEVIRSFNAVPFLAYWDIYKQYYANKQEEIGAVIHRPYTAVGFTIAGINYHSGTFPGGVALPQSPGTVVHALDSTSSLVINMGSGTLNPDQLVLNVTGGQQPASWIFTNWTQTSPTQWIASGFAASAVPTPAVIFSWDYGDPLIVNTTDEPIVQTFPLVTIDEMREAIMSATNQGATAFNVNAEDKIPYSWVLNRVGTAPNYFYSRLASQEGLAIKTYQSDLFNNWINTDWIDGVDGITAITSIDTSAGFITIDSINLAKKVYDFLNRVAVSGGTYDDWLDVTYTNERVTRAESPIYHGGLIKEVVFQEVISMTQSTSQDNQNPQPLGTLAGRGVLSDKHKGGSITIKVSEPGYIIGIVSLTPRIDYSQGNKWDIDLESMDDLHKPALDEIGFQELMTEQLAWWTVTYDASGTKQQYSAGKQPAWINYMTNVNKVRGNFAIKNNQMFMVLNRNYEYSEFGATHLQDLTTYIDPAKYNHIFAQTSRDAQNFWVQLGVKITARRLMSARLIPNL